LKACERFRAFSHIVPPDFLQPLGKDGSVNGMTRHSGIMAQTLKPFKQPGFAPQQPKRGRTK